MRDEILKARGRLAGLERKKEDAELKIKGLIVLVRGYADPYEHDLSKLKAKELRKAAMELESAQEEFLNISKQVQELKDGLE